MSTKKIFAIVLAVLIMVTAMPVIVLANEVRSIRVNPEEIMLSPGMTRTIRATVRFEGDSSTSGDVSYWESDDDWIAEVSGNGSITARNIGSTTIRAFAGNRVASVSVTVVSAAELAQMTDTISTPPATGTTTVTSGTPATNA